MQFKNLCIHLRLLVTDTDSPLEVGTADFGLVTYLLRFSGVSNIILLPIPTPKGNAVVT